MPRLAPVALASAQGKSKELLTGVQKKFGMVPNMMATMAQSPAALDGYLAFSGALAGGTLDARVREQIALIVGQQNACDYCVAAHTAIGKMVGLADSDILSARRASAPSPKVAAILTLASRLVETRGHATEADLAAARSAGVSDAEIAETVANVALNIYTNYFNHVAATTIDFPKPAAL
ncbi:MAG: carboxymuconolactone decarboxylase family protein [Planctomycetota bacterium]|nr:carboxymuconolactone decarboxylase family protein [Planctomycetota bacterium]